MICSGGDRRHFLITHTSVSGAERRMVALSVWHCRIGARVPASKPPSGATLVESSTIGGASSGSGHGSLTPTTIDPGKLSLGTYPDRVQPSKAAFIGKADGNLRSGRPGLCVVTQGSGRSHTDPPVRRLMLAPSHEQHGRQYRVGKIEQEKSNYGVRSLGKVC